MVGSGVGCVGGGGDGGGGRVLVVVGLGLQSVAGKEVLCWSGCTLPAQVLSGSQESRGCFVPIRVAAPGAPIGPNLRVERVMHPMVTPPKDCFMLSAEDLSMLGGDLIRTVVWAGLGCWLT